MYSFRIDLNPHIVFSIDQTDVAFLNGNKTSIYETGRILQKTLNPLDVRSITFGLVEILMSPKYYKIIETIEYQPIINKRVLNNLTDPSAFNNTGQSMPYNLNSLAKELTDRNEYYYIFVLAQIGGLYSFLKLIFANFFWFIIQKLYIMDLLNIIRFKLKHKRLKDIFNVPNSSLSKVSPLVGQNNKDYEELPLENRSSKFQNQDFSPAASSSK